MRNVVSYDPIKPFVKLAFKRQHGATKITMVKYDPANDAYQADCMCKGEHAYSFCAGKGRRYFFKRLGTQRVTGESVRQLRTEIEKAGGIIPAS